jgi:hypothetical protein
MRTERLPITMRGVLAAALLAAPACAPHPAAQPTPVPEYLHLWTASADSTQPDFLAVLDITDTGDSARYGRLVTTLPVPGLGNGPHHTEHEMAADRQLFANGFGSGQTFIFDLKDPANPRLAGQFGDIAGYSHPHSFLRLPDGHLLATFQMRHEAAGMAPGGLVELTPDGKPVRSRSANAPGLDPATRVYSAGIVPVLDRIVTTTTDMHADSPASRQLQIWRLSDLTLLHTITLPNGPRGDESTLTAEPRILADGRTVLVSTFACGLYLMEGLDGPSPSARLVASFPRKERTYCAIPVIAGNYYLVTVPAWSAVVSLDISDRAALDRDVGGPAAGGHHRVRRDEESGGDRALRLRDGQGGPRRALPGGRRERAGVPDGRQGLAARGEREGDPARGGVQPLNLGTRQNSPFPVAFAGLRGAVFP